MIRFGIALATCDPDIAFFKEQVQSIRNQHFNDWVCVIGDDSSQQQMSSYIQNSASQDRRFHYFKNSEQAGVMGNFEQIIKQLISISEYIVLCDQDDVWSLDRLSVVDSHLKHLQESRSTPVRFINSNMSLIDAGGHTICSSLWNAERRLVEFTHPISYLFANTVTGCGAIVQSDLIRSVGIPFPRSSPYHRPAILHDGWLAMCAAALGPIDLLWEPLVGYRQHNGNTIGLRKDYQTSMRMLCHQVLHPDLCLGTAKILLPFLEELSRRVPDRIESEYSCKTIKVIIKATWSALMRLSWSLPEWVTALIGVCLFISINRLKKALNLCRHLFART